MNAKRMPNLKEDQLRRAVEHLNNKKRGDVCTGDVAEHLGYHASGILLQLKKLESKGVLECRYIQGGRLPLWSLTGKKRCSSCDKFLEYTGTEWACTECQKELFEEDVLSCFKQFNTESEKCKRCQSAVECYEARQ